MEITERSASDLVEFLKYFYPKLAPKLRLTRGNVAQILDLAEQYQVPEVKAMCERKIEKISVSEKSVARVMPWLKIAFDYNMENLQKHIVHKISKSFPQFDRTPTYKALPTPLKLELMNHANLMLRERLNRIQQIAFDENLGRNSSGHPRVASSYSTTYKNRVINIQSLFSGWEDG